MKPLIQSAKDTYFPGEPVNTSATKKGWDKKRSILRARATANLSSSDNSTSEKYLIPVALNLNYYFFDETFSPFLGIGFGFENFRNSNKYVFKPVIGISNEKLKAFARFGFGNTIGSSIEIGIGYSFKERPCGCFPQTR